MILIFWCHYSTQEHDNHNIGYITSAVIDVRVSDPPVDEWLASGSLMHVSNLVQIYITYLFISLYNFYYGYFVNRAVPLNILYSSQNNKWTKSKWIFANKYILINRHLLECHFWIRNALHSHTQGKEIEKSRSWIKTIVSWFKQILNYFINYI